ncbi:hypothetical protein MBCUT_09550 [Methanobrevibacter cuticularis]|uniref:Uncharacterized protein n=1 Tax=Methanobrevibacter cuticularis TaxID=47311 RepID=A0A166CRI9_9EURY|nr:hypothetical protein MBCUT_09550 [Methanobrevibacter cuticularis]
MLNKDIVCGVSVLDDCQRNLDVVADKISIYVE